MIIAKFNFFTPMYTFLGGLSTRLFSMMWVGVAAYICMVQGHPQNAVFVRYVYTHDLQVPEKCFDISPTLQYYDMQILQSFHINNIAHAGKCITVGLSD